MSTTLLNIFFGVAFFKRQLEYITPFKELTQYLKQYLYPTKCFANVPFKSTINRTMTMFDWLSIYLLYRRVNDTFNNAYTQLILKQYAYGNRLGF